jgi:hypothetical protein
MKDKKKILAGLAVFIAAITFPFWYNMGKAAPAPEVELTEKAKAAKVCVMPTALHASQSHATAGCVAAQRDPQRRTHVRQRRRQDV